MIWKVKPDLAVLNQMRQQTAVGHLGIEFVEVGDDYLAATMPVDERTRQPMGLLHGGASVLLAETLGSVASTLCVDFPRQQCVGLEINASHLRAVREGKVKGVARPIRLGRRVHVWEIRIADDKGRPVCAARLTMAILEDA
ncbi:MAG: hotdog fold thioesterase [Chloroflexi bacterium]|nr:hotdog fold thioesterase [Chloroflexota bacterium]